MNVTSSTALKILTSANSVSTDVRTDILQISEAKNKPAPFKSNTSLKIETEADRKKVELAEKTKLSPEALASKQSTEAFLNMRQQQGDDIRALQVAESKDNNPWKAEYDHLQDLRTKSDKGYGYNLFTSKDQARMEELGRLMTFEEMEKRLDWAITGKDPWQGNSLEKQLETLRQFEKEAQANGQDTSSISNTINDVLKMMPGAPARNAYFFAQNSEAIALFVGSLEANNHNDGTKSGYALMSDSLRSKVDIWRRDFSNDPKLHEKIESCRAQRLDYVERTLDDILSGKVRIDMREKEHDRQIEGFRERFKAEEEKGQDVSGNAQFIERLEYQKKRDLAMNPWDPDADNKKIEMFLSSIEDGTFAAGVKAGFSDMSDSLKAKLEIWTRDFRKVPDQKINDQNERNQQIRNIETMVDYVINGKAALDAKIAAYDKQIEDTRRQENAAKNFGEVSNRFKYAIESDECSKKYEVFLYKNTTASYMKSLEQFYNTIENGDFQAGVKDGLADLSDSLKAKLEIWKRDFRPDLAKAS
jgi:hypothetical protein